MPLSLTFTPIFLFVPLKLSSQKKKKLLIDTKNIGGAFASTPSWKFYFYTNP